MLIHNALLQPAGKQPQTHICAKFLDSEFVRIKSLDGRAFADAFTDAMHIDTSGAISLTRISTCLADISGIAFTLCIGDRDDAKDVGDGARHSFSGCSEFAIQLPRVSLFNPICNESDEPVMYHVYAQDTNSTELAFIKSLSFDIKTHCDAFVSAIAIDDNACVSLRDSNRKRRRLNQQ